MSQTTPHTAPIERRTVDASTLARQLGVSERFVYKLAASGELHAVRLAGRVLFPADLVDQLLASPVAQSVDLSADLDLDL